MILVTGATGYIGSRLLKQLQSDGHKVKALVLQNDPLISSINGINCEIVYGDITKKETLKNCFTNVTTLFHLAAILVSHDKKLFHEINYMGTKNVVEAAIESNVKHVVYLSAAAAGYKIPTTYGKTKLESENLMKPQNNTNFTIIRPTLVYGEGGSHELKTYVEALKKFPLIIPLVGKGNALKKPVWIGDVIKGLSLTLNKSITYNKTYNFVGGTELTVKQYTKFICNFFNIEKPILLIPLPLCCFIAFLLNIFFKRPTLNKDRILGVTMDANDSEKLATDDFGYLPITLKDGYNIGFSRKEDLF